MKAVFYILALFLVLGCGARKTYTSIVTADHNTDLAATGEKKKDLQQNSSSEVSGQKEKVTVTETAKTNGKATPIDPNKPMDVIQDGNKTTINNGTWETGSENTKTETKEKETTRQKDTTTVQLKEAEKQTVTLKEQEKVKAKAKVTAKEQFNYLSLSIVLILLAIPVLYYLFKRRKDENTKDIPSGELE